MRLIIVRHGETFENKQNICQGHLDTELSDDGVLQIKKISNRLKNEEIDFILSSDLIRTKNTAKEILKFHPKAKLILHKELREQNKDIYEGKHRKFLEEATKKTGRNYFYFKPENGESMYEVQKNIVRFYDELIKKYVGKTVLIVSHGGIILNLLMTLNNEDKENYRKYVHKNTAISILDIDEDKNHSFEVFNCIRHLKKKEKNRLRDDSLSISCL
jgi:broad specificity phosphatase PhoE